MTMDERLFQADFDARLEALDVTRSFIIQAPAGSGKTELLIQRYLSLLAVVANPEEVIAITFTRKAAAEMQLRVLQALRRRNSNDVPIEEHERRTYELAGVALARSESLQWNLLGNPRRLRILTLDALNGSIARARPLTGAPTCPAADAQQPPPPRPPSPPTRAARRCCARASCRSVSTQVSARMTGCSRMEL